MMEYPYMHENGIYIETEPRFTAYRIFIDDCSAGQLSIKTTFVKVWLNVENTKSQ